MKARIAKLWSLEIEDDFSTFSPSDDKSFGTWVRMSVGPADESGTESFDIFVCTPRWLSDQLKKGTAPIWAHHHLIVDSFDAAAIVAELNRAVEQCSGRDWAEVAKHLSRIGAWEFEDYKPKG
jgi:hypothetical protein